MSQTFLSIEGDALSNDWEKCPLDISEYEGFVYIIENVKDDKFYVGKKSFWSHLTKSPLKGKKQKRHIKKESDWKNYWGSSNQLLSDIQTLGKENFKRTIIRLCKSKWELAYWEAKEQFDRDVIFLESSYNGILNLRVPKAPKELRR